MTSLPDATVDHLRRVSAWPEPEGTRYEILEKLGSGGMGTVYLARDCELQREVALKVLTSVRVDVGTSERILAEARILARLEHPGIVPVHDVGKLRDGRVFYVMKRVRGSRLDERARELPSIGDGLRLFERICEPVAFAHAHGVLHRDLKPENVMVGAFGEVLVLDWGVAKLSSPSPADPLRAMGGRQDRSITAAGEAFGTPGYMAPEQARGESKVDQRIDVHALGAILRFLMTGEPPRVPASAPGTGDSGRDGLGGVRTGSGQAPRPGSGQVPRGGAGQDVTESDRSLPREDRRWLASRGGRDRIPRPVMAIYRKAMAAEPENRFRSVPELSADVSRFLAGVGVDAYPENLIERARRFSKRHQTAILLIAAYLVMRMAILLWGRL